MIDVESSLRRTALVLAIVCWSVSPARADVAITDETGTPKTVTSTQLATLMPSEVVEVIKKGSSADIETSLKSLTTEQRNEFFAVLRKTLEVKSIEYTKQDLEKIERLAVFYDATGIFYDAFLAKNPCNDDNAASDEDCQTKVDGQAFGLYSRAAGQVCWKTLKRAQGASSAFREGIRDYYTRANGAEAPELGVCDIPPLPERCKLAWCFKFRERGIAVRPLTDLGIAVPLGNPTFGFKRDATVAAQASAGLMIRGFIKDGNLDLRLGFGITNAVDSDGETSAIGLVWTTQISAFEILGAGLLGIVNPRNKDESGVAFVFALDLAGIRERLGEVIAGSGG